MPSSILSFPPPLYLILSKSSDLIFKMSRFHQLTALCFHLITLVGVATISRLDYHNPQSLLPDFLLLYYLTSCFYSCPFLLQSEICQPQDPLNILIRSPHSLDSNTLMASYLTERIKSNLCHGPQAVWVPALLLIRPRRRLVSPLWSTGGLAFPSSHM